MSSSSYIFFIFLMGHQFWWRGGERVVEKNHRMGWVEGGAQPLMPLLKTQWGLEISWGYIEKICGNSRGQLKKELAFPGVIKKVLVFGPGRSMRFNTAFPGLRGKASFCLEFLRSNKPKNSTISFQKSMSSTPSPPPACWIFSGWSPLPMTD